MRSTPKRVDVTRAAPIAVALVAVVLGGCSEDGSAATPAGPVEVDVRMFDFEPAVVEVGVGQTVTWTNHDATLHTVTSGVDGEPDGGFELVLDGSGESGSVTFDEPGEYPYFCGPHTFMTGTVVVQG